MIAEWLRYDDNVCINRPNHNPNRTTELHAVASIQLNIVACHMYRDKFIRDNVTAPFILLSVDTVSLYVRLAEWATVDINEDFISTQYCCELEYNVLIPGLYWNAWDRVELVSSSFPGHPESPYRGLIVPDPILGGLSPTRPHGLAPVEKFVYLPVVPIQNIWKVWLNCE